MKDISEPPWRVANTLDLDPKERSVAGLIVITGPPRNASLIADCRNDTIPVTEQRANARLCAKGPKMAKALLDLEDAIGDLPASKAADVVYSIIVKVLRDIELEPRHPRVDE